MSRVDYEKFWQGYWNDTTVYGPACRHRRRMVAELIRKVPHETILDLGCGDGSLLAELSGSFTKSKLAGSDISEEALRIARQNAPGVEFFQLDLSSEKRVERKFDVVVMSEVLEHIEDDEYVMRQVAPIARHIVVSVPGGPADKVDRRYGHFRNYPGRLMAEKLERSGYAIIQHNRWGFPIYDLQQHFAFQPGEEGSATMSQGRYGPLRKAVALATYWLYFLNSNTSGTQVFALARSKLCT